MSLNVNAIDGIIELINRLLAIHFNYVLAEKKSHEKTLGQSCYAVSIMDWGEFE